MTWVEANMLGRAVEEFYRDVHAAADKLVERAQRIALGPTTPPMKPITPQAQKRATFAERMEALLDYVREHPHQRMEQIARGMGRPSRELTGPMERLVATKQLKPLGKTRGRSYSVPSPVTAPVKKGRRRG